MIGKIIDRLWEERAVLVLLLMVGFAVRLYGVNNPIADWHSWRQADTAAVSRIYVEDGINLLYPRYYDISSIQSGITNFQGYRFVEFPLYNAVVAILTKFLPLLSVEVWGRLASMMMALSSAVLLYFIGNRFLAKWGGVLTSFFFLFIPYNIYFSRVILPEPTAVFFGLLSIWWFVKSLDQESNLFYILSALSMAVAILVKPHVIFYTVPIILLWAEEKGIEAFFTASMMIRSLTYFFIVFVPFIVWRGWINQYPQGIPFMAWSFNGDHIRFRPAFFRWIVVERLGRLILGVWGIYPFVVGLTNVKKKAYFIFYFLLGMIGYVVVFASANVRHDYYQIFLVPAVSLMLAWGCLSVNKTKWSVTILTATIILMVGAGVYQVKEYYKINHPEIVEAGRRVDEITPKDAWVIAPYNGDTAFLYQTKRFGWPAIDNSFEYLIRKGAGYYVTVTPKDADSVFVAKNFKVIEQTDRYFIADLNQPI